LEIGERGGLPVEITHIKLGTTPVWHLTAKRMPQIFAAAKRRHLRLTADVYPYTFWHSDIRVIMLDRDYFNPKKVAKVIAENGGADHIHVVHYEPEPAMNGKDLAQIADAWQMTPVQAYMRIVKATLPQPDGTEPEEDVIVESMSEDDLRWFIANPNIMYCTDGGLEMQHPRSAGSFPRILGHYARDLKLLPLEEAVRKMTSMPAQQLGLADRGKIAPGYVADLVLFDPATIIDRSTLGEWDAPPLGIPAVMVSGQWVVRDGKVTGALPGKVLRHAPSSAAPARAD
jgi:N-acyl-D-amino-acid deacylase